MESWVLQVDDILWRAVGSIDISRSLVSATSKVFCTGWSYVPL